MTDGPVASERLVSEAFRALAMPDCLDAQTARNILARTAKALAWTLPVYEWSYDPDTHGPPMSPEEIKKAAMDARFFLELVADLLGDPTDPDWTGDSLAFVGTLKKRPGWKSLAEATPAQDKRRAAAVRVYELMAKQGFDTGQPPKQEAAIAAVMDEFGLARSKVMQGLRDYRQSFVWLCPDDDPHKGRVVSRGFLMNLAMEKERLRRDGPHDPAD